MSMLARYVQVTPAELEELRGDPSSLPGLFDTDMSLEPFIRLADEARARMERTPPQVLSQALSTLHPTIQEGLAQRLGVESLGTEEGGSALLRLMTSKGLVPPGGDEPAQLTATSERQTLSLDKAWHGVHYLLSGRAEEPTSEAPGNAVLGGTEIGDDDFGYGPARYFTPSEVADIASALGRPGLDDETEARYKPDRLIELEIYPGGWDDDAREWLLDALDDLREFFHEAAAQECAVLTALV
jgi:hypothetical protein